MAKDNKKFVKVLDASKAEAIAFVAEGLPVTADGYHLKETDMQNIETALEAGDKAAADLATTQAELKTANEARVKAEGDLKAANATIAKLENKDGTPASTPAATTDPKHVVKETEDEFRCDFDDQLKVMRDIM